MWEILPYLVLLSRSAGGRHCLSSPQSAEPETGSNTVATVTLLVAIT